MERYEEQGQGQEQGKLLPGGAEPGSAGSAEPGSSDRPGRSPARHYTRAEKLELLRRYEASGEPQRDFCREQGISTSTLGKWREAFQEGGEAALEPQSNPGNRSGTRGRTHRPEERRAAVEAFEQSGLSRKDFAATFGVSTVTLGTWIARYKEGGPKALEPKQRKGGRVGKGRLAQAVRTEIVRTKARFPTFGLKRIRDFLGRFRGLRVSTGSVRKTLLEEGVARSTQPGRKRRAKPALPRRFERARPMQLWQSDITSFVLARSGRRVYLTVFLDDHSRYVVSFALATSQRTDLVVDCLQEGLARFGKPSEILTDQGRQYYSWRGKSGFQKLLAKEGIAHVVSRAHHPETLGKCERLWETVNREFWERVRPDELADARARLAHFFAHYNHFRPHQGIDGLIPADRFFGAADPLRQTLEKTLAQNELALALEEPLRRPLYLFGQLGDQQLSLVGERGRLVIHTSDGVHQEMHLDELGVNRDERTEASDGDERVFGEQVSRNGEQWDEHGALGAAQASAHGEEAGALQDPSPSCGLGAGLVAERERGGAGTGTPDLHDDAVALARQDEPPAGGGGALDTPAPGVAALAAGAVGYAGGAFEAAEGTPLEGGANGDGSQGRPQSAEEGSGDAAEAAEDGGGFAAHLPGDAAREERGAATDERGGGEEAPGGFGGEKRARAGAEEAPAKGSPSSSGRWSGNGSGRGSGSSAVTAPGSEEPWV